MNPRWGQFFMAQRGQFRMAFDRRSFASDPSCRRQGFLPANGVGRKAVCVQVALRNSVLPARPAVHDGRDKPSEKPVETLAAFRKTRDAAMA